HRIITDLGVLDVTTDGLTLVETAPGITVEDITARTDAPVRLDGVAAYSRDARSRYPVGGAGPRADRPVAH
ncbi:hypothetical protein ACWEEL_36870, partial [Streptomyces sp. NPDC005009]